MVSGGLLYLSLSFLSGAIVSFSVDSRPRVTWLMSLRDKMLVDGLTVQKSVREQSEIVWDLDKPAQNTKSLRNKLWYARHTNSSLNSHGLNRTSSRSTSGGIDSLLHFDDPRRRSSPMTIAADVINFMFVLPLLYLVFRRSLRLQPPSPSGFSNAPVTKGLVGYCAMSMIYVALSGADTGLSIDVWKLGIGRMLINLMSFVLYFPSWWQSLCGIFLFYRFRQFERHWGASKISSLLSIALVVLGRDGFLQEVACGPYGILIMGFRLSDKSLTYLVALHLLLFRVPGTLAASVTGIVSEKEGREGMRNDLVTDSRMVVQQRGVWPTKMEDSSSNHQICESGLPPTLGASGSLYSSSSPPMLSDPLRSQRNPVASHPQVGGAGSWRERRQRQLQQRRQDAEEEPLDRSAGTRDRWAPPSMQHGGLDEIEEAPVNGEL
ncbi:hypothetical protein GUITHDRAFT_132416 [Guillardia theta CCMP2712]|uniref:Derlin n=1 Tax=Guillardia theta (strain CCMP2712) TaxID=905079 RepID=L1K038_GUITC|nr:hypothetical protein GUITHDRAFT_132416 [Guillardia theta CCMP2712]EKX53987.1 hypothetical protein GUITHDRAFT_132416 [Guillardia theta CCMP2712]|eukprot:XP_005840967.1 hypothetical protein GUITHDRAFT_132416 [Guillardia theta CCMP2712]